MRNGYYQLLNYINMTDTHDVFYYAALNILDHLEEIPNSSIVQVADLCYASTATISRLCRRLNYPSFNAFKQDKMCIRDRDNYGNIVPSLATS